MEYEDVGERERIRRYMLCYTISTHGTYMLKHDIYSNKKRALEPRTYRYKLYMISDFFKALNFNQWFLKLN
jgi:hypothetical protein